MLTLSTELKELGRGYAVQHRQDEDAEFRENVRLAKEIAEQMIAELPAFLKGIASTTHARFAYLVSIDAYRPWRWEWPNKDAATPETYTVHQCRRALFGVPRHIAIWAVRQGMTVNVGHATAMWDQVVFQRERHGSFYKESKGIIVHW